MALLIRGQRQPLIDMLLRLPNISNAAARNLLLADLPALLQNSIPFDAAPATHIGNIVDATDKWGVDPGETPPLIIILENALFAVRGSQLGRELQTMLDTLKAQAARTGAPAPVPTPPDPEVPNSAVARSTMSLSGPQFKQLQQALLDIFPTWDELASMVRTTYNKNLGALAGTGPLDGVIFRLIQWAESRGQLPDLIAAAVAENPKHGALAALAAQFGVPIPSPTKVNAPANDPLPDRDPPVAKDEPVSPTGATGLESAERDIAPANQAANDPAPPAAGAPPAADDTRKVRLTDERLTPTTLAPRDKDLLYNLLRQVPAVATGGRVGLYAFLERASLPDTWYQSRSWGDDPLTIATNLVTYARNLDIPIQSGRPGFTALGSILNQLFMESSLGLADGRRVAALITRYKLIPSDKADVAPELQVLLQRVPNPSQEEVPAGLEAALRQAAGLMDRYLDARWLSDGARATQAVCYIRTAMEEGTGFLLGPDLVLTNYHVVASEIQNYNPNNPTVPANVEIRFGYQVETGPDGDPVTRPGTNHPLTQNWLVDCSPVSSKGFAQVQWLHDFNPVGGLDYALLRLADAPGNEALRGGTRGWLPTPGGTVQLKDPLFIIQHPRPKESPKSQPLKVVLSYDAVSAVDATHIKYMTNTDPGASGSPCFNIDWQLVALHHKGDLDPAHPTGNEGIRIDVILDQPKVKAALPS